MRPAPHEAASASHALKETLVAKRLFMKSASSAASGTQQQRVQRPPTDVEAVRGARSAQVTLTHFLHYASCSPNEQGVKTLVLWPSK